jgi:hypothetical protein
MNVISPYEHRKNTETSFDSICVTCYQIVGKRRSEAELDQDEKVHACNGAPPRLVSLILNRLQDIRRKCEALASPTAIPWLTKLLLFLAQENLNLVFACVFDISREIVLPFAEPF